MSCVISSAPVHSTPPSTLSLPSPFTCGDMLAGGRPVKSGGSPLRSPLIKALPQEGARWRPSLLSVLLTHSEASGWLWRLNLLHDL